MSKKERIWGFDYVRAILAVVATHFHTAFFGIRMQDFLHQPTFGPDYFPSTIQIVFFNFFFHSIPSFFMMSLFLIYHFREQKGIFQKRLNYLVQLFLFWFTMQNILLFFTKRDRLNYLFSDFNLTLQWIVSGAYSEFWFLFSLISLVILFWGYLILQSHFSFFKKRSTQWALFIIAILFVLTIPYFHSKDNYLIPLSFLPLIFITPIIYQLWVKNKINTKWIIGFGIIWLLGSLLDWILRITYTDLDYLFMVIPMFARFSISFGALIIICSALLIPKKPPSFIRTLSDYALPIFCVHWFAPYCLEIMEYLVELGINIWIAEAIVTLYRVAFSIVVAYFARKVPYLNRYF